MVSFTRLLAIASLATCAFSSLVPHTVLERRSLAPPSFAKVSAAPEDHVISMSINLAMSDRDGLENALLQASMPGSPTFRQWLSKEQVESYARPTADTTKAVMDWLDSHSIRDISTSPSGDWLKFDIPVSTANALLKADYSVFRHTDSGATSVRTLEYSVPSKLAGLIRAVHPTTSFSGPSRGPAIVSVPPPQLQAADNGSASAGGASVNCSAVVTPACLQDLYKIPTTLIKNSKSSIAVTGFDQQNASFADAKQFLQQFRPDMDPNTNFTVELFDSAFNSQDPDDAGGESNLDVQYTLGLVNGIPTSFIDFGLKFQDGPDQGFLDMITDLNAMDSPPLVVSTSYGFPTEDSLSQSLTSALCDEYMKLTSRGVSITFASGDGGVASTPDVKCDGQPFPPTFPTCPYATLVGSTRGIPETGAEFSAGGFSNYFAQPTWQAENVAGYLYQLHDTYAGKFNRTGRAYPDVSAQGLHVQVVIGGITASIGGTSASSPIFSSIIALLNDRLLAAGKAPLGFLNPWLYKHPEMFHDVSTGSNPGCGTDGFPARPGWDPVTGLGTPNFDAMLKAALAA